MDTQPWLQVVFQTTSGAMARDWGRVFARDGLTMNQESVSRDLFRALGWAEMPTLSREPPTAEEAQCLFPKRLN